jgi:hypothetical protein
LLSQVTKLGKWKGGRLLIWSRAFDEEIVQHKARDVGMAGGEVEDVSPLG